MNSKKFLKQILTLLLPYRKKLILIGFAILLYTAFFIGLPFGFQIIFDKIIIDKDIQLLWFTAFAIIAGFIIATIADLIQGYLAGVIGAGVISDLRLQLFTKIQNMPETFFANTPNSDLLSKFFNDINAVDRVVSTSLFRMIGQVLIFIFSIVLLFIFEWHLAILTILIFPLVLFGPKVLTSHATEATYKRYQEESKLASYLEEIIRGRKEIHIFRLESIMRKKFLAALSSWKNYGVRSNLFLSYVIQSSNFAIMFIYIVIILVGANLTILDKMSSGTLIAFFTILLSVGDAVSQFTELYPDLIKAKSGFKRVQEVLNPVEIKNSKDLISEIEEVNGNIQFDGVKFGYNPSTAIFDGLNLSITAGTSVAFVGQSGSGKSTILSLLTRTYDPEEGVISIDGNDILNIAPQFLFKIMAPVFQENYIFAMSIRENIRLGRLDANDREVELAAIKAEIHDTIMSLPEKYETFIGETGHHLSGGQKQRIAIARAILRDPKILILDEATSALDPITEKEINKTIAQLSGKCTIISVTHRLSSVVDADCIFVMVNGKIINKGSHLYLLNKCTQYSEMWQKQNGFIIKEKGNHASVSPERLQKIPLFESIELDFLKKLAGQFISVQYHPGDVLIKEGDIGDKFFVIVRGRARVFQKGSAGKLIELGIREDGDVFGEIALLKDQPRMASIVALTDCLCLILDRYHFNELLEKQSGIREIIFELIRNRLKET
ncbi:MAG: ATP-binding cassette domain-containing protein [Leptospiraceae bacterium]|nr:ATP-binding cassette domain-containing protein [Leptospiraceae bacterium]